MLVFFSGRNYFNSLAILPDGVNNGGRFLVSKTNWHFVYSQLGKSYFLIDFLNGIGVNKVGSLNFIGSF